MAGAGSWWTISLLTAGLSGLPVLFGFAAYYNGYWLPIVVLEAALIISVVAALTGRYALEGRQKRFIKNAFSQYLSPVFIEELIRNPEKLKLGGERRVISIFFSDLQGFTGLSEKLDPEDLTAFLNHYLTAMTEIIHQEGGTVDKYEGDAIIAFWNAPLDLEDHAERAVRAGLRCLDKLEEMQPELRKWVQGEVRMRVGINTGPAVVGNMGSHDRFDYTMLGDSVNLAARLEGVNKQFGTWILISENTLQQIGNTIPVREIARVTVVGRDKPVAIYEPLSARRQAEHMADLQSFTDGLELFRQGNFLEAAAIFAATADRDPAAKAYEARCRDFTTHPPRNWDGVWRVTEKG
jgi:adenylate cyclase